MARNDMQRIWRRWNKTMREMKKHADANDQKSFIANVEKMKDSLDRWEITVKTTDSDGAHQISMFERAMNQPMPKTGGII